MSDLSLPSLVTVAHGTRRAGGNEIARQITRGAGVALGVESTAAYVELSEPLLADVVAGLDSPAVVVPLLLSTGFHVRTDLPRACAGGPVVLGRPLGPDPLLAAAQVARLVAAGIEPGRPLVLVAAGSTPSPGGTCARPPTCWPTRGAPRSARPRWAGSGRARRRC